MDKIYHGCAVSARIVLPLHYKSKYMTANVVLTNINVSKHNFYYEDFLCFGRILKDVSDATILRPLYLCSNAWQFFLPCVTEGVLGPNRGYEVIINFSHY